MEEEEEEYYSTSPSPIVSEEEEKAEERIDETGKRKRKHDSLTPEKDYSEGENSLSSAGKGKQPRKGSPEKAQNAHSTEGETPGMEINPEEETKEQLETENGKEEEEKKRTLGKKKLNQRK